MTPVYVLYNYISYAYSTVNVQSVQEITLKLIKTEQIDKCIGKQKENERRQTDRSSSFVKSQTKDAEMRVSFNEEHTHARAYIRTHAHTHTHILFLCFHGSFIIPCLFIASMRLWKEHKMHSNVFDFRFIRGFSEHVLRHLCFRWRSCRWYWLICPLCRWQIIFHLVGGLWFTYIVSSIIILA